MNAWALSTKKEPRKYDDFVHVSETIGEGIAAVSTKLLACDLAIEEMLEKDVALYIIPIEIVGGTANSIGLTKLYGPVIVLE
jgi:hypothetical protein